MNTLQIIRNDVSATIGRLLKDVSEVDLHLTAILVQGS